MRYAPPGLCVNDFALLRDEDGTYAVLHLQGPWTAEFDHLRMETSYGRATSTDLVTGRPGAPPSATACPAASTSRPCGPCTPSGTAREWRCSTPA
jgi:hypothetical protein